MEVTAELLAAEDQTDIQQVDGPGAGLQFSGYLFAFLQLKTDIMKWGEKIKYKKWDRDVESMAETD